jgi:hypothetical protein
MTHAASSCASRMRTEATSPAPLSSSAALPAHWLAFPVRARGAQQALLATRVQFDVDPRPLCSARRRREACALPWSLHAPSGALQGKSVPFCWKNRTDVVAQHTRGRCTRSRPASKLTALVCSSTFTRDESCCYAVGSRGEPAEATNNTTLTFENLCEQKQMSKERPSGARAAAHGAAQPHKRTGQASMHT